MREPGPAPQISRIRSFFDAEAREYLLGREEQPSFASQRDLVLSLLPARMRSVLDVGCGPAVMAPALLARADQVHGLDASEEMIAHGRARLLGHPDSARCRLDAGDAEDLRFADATFDAVIAMGVIEYLLSYDRAIAEMHRVLRPGGTLVLTLQNRVAAYRIAREAVEVPREIAKRMLGRAPAASRAFVTNRCVPWQLNRQLVRAGFRDVLGRYCNFVFYPLHEMSPGLSGAIDRRLSRLGRSAAGTFLGTQYVVRALKT